MPVRILLFVVEKPSEAFVVGPDSELAPLGVVPEEWNRTHHPKNSRSVARLLRCSGLRWRLIYPTG